MTSKGRGIRADAPPDKKITSRSFFFTFSIMFRIFFVPITPLKSGMG